jgi:hypothetical protein
MYNKFPKQGGCLWIGIAWDTIAEKVQNRPAATGAAIMIAAILLYPSAKKYDKRDESNSRKSRPWND